MSDLTQVPSGELIRELIARYDTAIFVALRFADEKRSKYYLKQLYHGTPIDTLALSHLVAVNLANDSLLALAKNTQKYKDEGTFEP